MKPSRLIILLIGLTSGVAYAFITMLIVSNQERNVSVTYIFILPMVLDDEIELFWLKYFPRIRIHTMKKKRIYSIIRGYFIILISEYIAWAMLALITLVIYLITLLF